MMQLGRYNMIGTSEAMSPVYAFIEQVTSLPSRYKMPLILSGERGTGKELVARAIHGYGKRKSAPFIPFNCTAVTETITEAELFGYKKGSFTGANKDRNGLFQEAEGGTIYIDEIASMPLHMQSKLLRALQEQKIRPVGSSQEVDFDAQIIVSSNKSLEAAVVGGEFLPDLYDRLNVAYLRVPPLRERGQDIIIIAKYFAKKYGTLSEKGEFNFRHDAEKALLNYSWPGNVRQLEAAIQGIIGLVKCDSNSITYKILDEILSMTGSVPPISNDRQEHQDHPTAAGKTLKEMRIGFREARRKMIAAELERQGGNIVKTARVLGISRYVINRCFKP